MTSEKVLSLDALAEQVGHWQAEGDEVVHCHGVFDLLHVGHIKHLQAARQLGNRLVVTLTPDQFVNKGPTRPLFPEALRAEAIAALASVDAVAVNRWPTAVETLHLLKPNLYCKGSEYQSSADDVTGKIGDEEAAVRSVGGRLVFTDEQVFSSSNLINQNFSSFPAATQSFLSEFAQRHTARDLVRSLEAARQLKVLVVGETIIDEYHYCEAIGKSSKEPTLVAKSLSTEKFAGGILAVANHVASFSDHVSVLTMLGSQNTQQEYIEANLNPLIDKHFLYRHDSPTIVKHRVIEQYFFTKLLELYQFNDLELCAEDNDILCQKLESLCPQYDLVIVVDYGHGFLSQEAIKILCAQSKFLAVNTQSNAGNLGYHTISMYSRADYVTSTEGEMRLEARSRRGDLRKIVRKVAESRDYPRLIVTRGKSGCLGYAKGEDFCEVPAVAGKVVDRIGAGDAFLAVSALCAVQQLPLEVVALVGNAAGAQAVATVCNQKAVDRIGLFKQLETLLK